MTKNEYSIVLVGVIIIITISTAYIFPIPSEGQQVAKPLSSSPDTNKAKPVEGYDSPQGYFTAIKHVYNDPSLRVSVFCKPGVKIVATCQIYDSNSTNATLIGIEYIITAKDYNSLPGTEKANWYLINNALANTVQGQFPELSEQQVNVVLQHLLGNYGKTTLLWNPKDGLPTSPRVENLQTLFVANRTGK